MSTITLFIFIVDLFLIFSHVLSQNTLSDKDVTSISNGNKIYRTHQQVSPPSDNNQQSLARGVVNVQIFTQFKYDEKYIHIYDARSNLPTEPRQWKFFYVPVMKPIQPANNHWAWTKENIIRMDLIVGNDEIEGEARKAVIKKYEASIVGNASEYWDVTPLLINSLDARIVKSSHSPIQYVYPFKLLQPHQTTLSFQFECENEEKAESITAKLVDGTYQVEIAFFFDGFMTVDTNIVTISSEQFNSIMNKIQGDGTKTTPIYIHRHQTTQFTNKYLTQIKQVTYTENSNSDITQLTSSLTKQFMNLFNQGIENVKEVKLTIDSYKQIWSLSDLEPDELNNELNEQLIWNETATKRHSSSENYYNIKISAADSSPVEEQVTFGSFFRDLFRGRPLFEPEKKKLSSRSESSTKNIILSATEIKKLLSKQGVHGEWKGKKFYPKSFDVYRLTDIFDHMQTAITSIELRGEKKRGAIYRTISSFDKSTFVPMALFTGEIRLYTSVNVNPPFNWLRCDGTEISRTKYSRLFEVIGTMYGIGDNATTFNLPDFRGRFPLGFDQDGKRTNLATNLGNTGGQAIHRLTIDQLPAHDHDQGSFRVLANGSHNHDINNSNSNYTKINLQENNNTNHQNLHLIYVNNTNFVGNGTTQPIDIQLISHRLSVNTVDDHEHFLSGTSGLTGHSQEFSIINPFQTVIYIIYAG